MSGNSIWKGGESSRKKERDCDDLCKKLLGLVLGEVVKTSLPGLDLLLFEN